MIGFGLASDRIMKSMTAKGKPNKPEYRLITMIPGAVLLPIGLLWYGWTAEKGAFWLGIFISFHENHSLCIRIAISQKEYFWLMINSTNNRHGDCRMRYNNYMDIHTSLSRRCFHDVCRLCRGREYYYTLCVWSISALGRTASL